MIPSNIIKRSDNRSKSAANSQSISARLYKVENRTVFYTVTSGSGNKQYLVKIQLTDLDLSNLDSLEDALQGNIKIYCSCDAFLYHGYKYIAFKAKSGIEPETRAPKITNPNMQGMACKHILVALQQMKKDYNSIYELFNKQLSNSRDNRHSDNKSFTNNDLKVISEFKDACIELYNQYTKYIKDTKLNDSTSFQDSEYYVDVDPSNLLKDLSVPASKIVKNLFIGKLTSLEKILQSIESKRNGFIILLTSDTKSITDKINRNISQKTEAYINHLILELMLS